MKYYYLSPKTDTWMDVYIGLLGSIHLMWTNSELPRGRSHPTIVWKIGELQVDSPESTPTRPGPSRFELCFGSGLGPVKSCLKINKKSFVLHKKMKRQKEGENKRARERGRRREEEEKEEKKNRRRRGGAHLGCYCCRLWPGTPLPMLTRYATVFPAPSSFSIASTLVPFTLLKRNKINKRKIKQVKKPFKKGEKSRFRPSPFFHQCIPPKQMINFFIFPHSNSEIWHANFTFHQNEKSENISNISSPTISLPSKSVCCSGPSLDCLGPSTAKRDQLELGSGDKICS